MTILGAKPDVGYLFEKENLVDVYENYTLHNIKLAFIE